MRLVPVRAGRFGRGHPMPRIATSSEAYEMFREKKDGCIKIVLKP